MDEVIETKREMKMMLENQNQKSDSQFEPAHKWTENGESTGLKKNSRHEWVDGLSFIII